MDLKTIKNYSTKTYKKFSVRTNIHGFGELHISTFWQGKLFWSAMIISCLIISIYQVTRAFQQYINQPYITVIETVKEKDVRYPDVSLCYRHWLYWVDMEKSLRLKFTQETTLYGLSYLTDIYTNLAFDINNVTQEFYATMKRNNFTTLTDFFRAIAKDPPDHYGYFKETKLRGQATLCYVMKTQKILDDVIEHLDVHESDQERLRVIVEIEDSRINPLPAEFLSEKEKECYVARYLYQKAKDLNIVKELDGSGTIEQSDNMFTQLEIDQDVVELRPDDRNIYIAPEAKVAKWQNKHGIPCREDADLFHRDEIFNCMGMCVQNYYSERCLCMRFGHVAAKGVDDLPDKVCRSMIHFLTPTNHCASVVTEDSILQKTNNKSLISSCEIKSNQLCCKNTSKNRDAEVLKCRNNCVFACKTWKYTLSYVERGRRNTFKGTALHESLLVIITFPRSEEVLATIEINHQSFENFVGNIGGLLGIWMGASVLSIFQFFYLCCCGEFGCCTKRKASTTRGKIYHLDSLDNSIVEVELD